MSKSEERRKAIQAEAAEEATNSSSVRTYFYPPQDGRDAFVCEAETQEEADAKYKAAAEVEK